MSMISYQWSLKDTSVSGLGMDFKLKNVKCKKIYEAIRLTLLFFFFARQPKLPWVFYAFSILAPNC